MARNVKTEGLILKNTRFGEIHKSVTLLSPDLGVLNAIAHGSYKGKSKLGGVTEVFSRSLISLYHNPVSSSYKITEVEPISYYDSLRTDLEKFYIASLWSEMVLRTYAGGGDFGEVYGLCCDAMELLDRSPVKRNDVTLALFLFEYVDLLGYLPDFSFCARCGRKLEEVSEWYVGDGGSIYCRRCACDGLPVLTVGARRCLAYARGKPVDQKLKVDLDTASGRELKRAMLTIAQHVIGGPLKTLAGGVL